MNPAEVSSLLNNILNAIYTTLLIIGVLGAVIVWLISQRFVSKKRLGEILIGKETEIRGLEDRIVTLESDARLAKGPMANIEKGISAMQQQLVDLTKQVTDIDKRMAVNEAKESKKASRG